MEQQGTLWQAPWYVQSPIFQARPLGPGTFDVRYSDANGELHYGLQDEEARVKRTHVWPRRLLEQGFAYLARREGDRG